MRRIYFLKPFSIFSDAVIFLSVATFIYALTAFGSEWNSSYNPSYDISLSFSALPIYSLFSALRGFIAYLVSLVFTLSVGYWAAKSPKAEKVILPFLDIMQSIPVLGFLPGLVLGLVALFPHTNMGLELAAIIMIFTGQVWNMTFAFYSSLKSVPTDLKEAASVMKLNPLERLKLLELPYSAMNLTWNSVMSMAGGWFFLTVCEAFTLGDKAYRLPGLGAYMAVAIEKADTKAIIGGIFAMFCVIIFFDIVLWRPALVWAHKYRLEDIQDQTVDEPLIQLLIRDSFVSRLIRLVRMQRAGFKKTKVAVTRVVPEFHLPKVPPVPEFLKRGFSYTLAVVAFCSSLYACYRLVRSLAAIPFEHWLSIFRDSGFTLIRVFSALVIGTLWALPAGIWIAQSPRRLRITQPIIQMMASFPAPMLYPLAIAVFLFLNINFEISAMLLMLLGVQWYILFNVLAGALRIPVELRNAMLLMKSSKRDQWRYLFIPSVFPSLVTGWVTAAGGAWNASIVSEIIAYRGRNFEAHGLGAQISKAAEHANFPELAACLVVMVVIVVILNRTLWAKTYSIAQTRFRMDL